MLMAKLLKVFMISIVFNPDTVQVLIFKVAATCFPFFCGIKVKVALKPIPRTNYDNKDQIIENAVTIQIFN